MSINLTYIQEYINRKVKKVAPVSSAQKIRHNLFKNQYSSAKHNNSSSFEEVLEERIKIYQKGTRK